MIQNLQHILIIEDEEAYRDILITKLGALGYEISQAKDGEEGLKIALEKHPDLILLDIIMPNMDGLEMLRKLHQDAWGAQAKVVILSGVTDSQVIAEVMSNKTFQYLVKTDISIDDLVKKIQTELA